MLKICSIKDWGLELILSSITPEERRSLSLLYFSVSGCSESLFRFSTLTEIFGWMACSYVLPLLKVLPFSEKLLQVIKT